jgi:N-acetylglucosaminyldiphosphoundecaprenol N-acetyl-beta-D-mannosaminyltransferase
MKRIDFLGSPVDSVTMQDALQKIDDFVVSGRPHQILIMNANKLWQIRSDKRLRQITRAAELVVPEKAVVMGAALLGTPLKEHVGGIMLAMALLPHAEKQGHSIFFLGARPVIQQALLNKLRRDHPNLRIAGYNDGYFKPHEQAALLERIRNSKPDVLLVAMGTPRQEYWIRDHFNELGVPVYIGVGGTFDVLAGLKKDAPAWVRRFALEWLFRLVQDPRNLWRRYATTIPWFVSKVMVERIFGRKPSMLPAAER